MPISRLARSTHTTHTTRLQHSLRSLKRKIAEEDDARAQQLVVKEQQVQADTRPKVHTGLVVISSKPETEWFVFGRSINQNIHGILVCTFARLKFYLLDRLGVE